MQVEIPPAVMGPVRELGEFIRDQREHTQLSLRALAARAGVSNPYLSQVERGLRKPSADILNRIAAGLSISAESLLTKAGVLPERAGIAAAAPTVADAIAGDAALTRRQKDALLSIYAAFLAENGTAGTQPPATSAAEGTETGRATPISATTTTTNAPEVPDQGEKNVHQS